jgi:hypothetical protein
VRLVYRILAILIAVGVVVQAAAIAFALFDIEHRTDGGQVYSKDSHNGAIELHSMLGTKIIPLFGLLLLIVSFFAAIPGGVKWAAITFGVLVLQILLAFTGFSAPVLGLLHGINAFALAAVASIAMRKARRAEAPAATAAG